LVEILFWPALLAYGEAALAYAGEARRPGRAGRMATWGARLGWLVQTALLSLQAARSEGFPWGSWAASLNLFVWLLVGCYLVWGCRARFRLLGLAVMPFAASLLLASWLAGGIDGGGESRFSTLFLVLHVGLVLAAFAGFTVAAAVSALYLWEERRLKRRRTRRLLGRTPSLVTLDTIAGRTVALSLPALTAGMGVGLFRLSQAGGSVDALMVATLATWTVYALYLLLRAELGWRGRRAAYVALVGFVLVAAVRLVLPLTHFA
jgi:ABC-type uncharacterized transport system permease subunit